MEMIIEELTRIETSARGVVERAAAEKGRLDERIAKKADEITKAAEAMADAEAAEARAKAAAETDAKLAEINANAQRWAASLEKQYADNHAAWETEIFNRLLA
ncbi:MAG: hypothetical protein FWF44_03460 [Defluviitaleaceae bacterium]|nr:hypothetical protein [Defluviitaleaceae bacterium]